MKTFAIALAVAAAGAASAQTPPTFAADWTGVVAQHVVVNQGGVANSDGSVTCPAQAPECKVQTGFQGARQYVSSTQNKQKIAAPDNSGIVIDVAAGKEYQVDATNTCTGYCPLPSDFGNIEPLALFPNSTYSNAAGNSFCNGKTPCSAWTSLQQPILNITFETDIFYVSGNTPLGINEILTPFGMPIGYQTTNWMSYTPGAIPASVFDVKGTSNTTTCALLQCSKGGSSSSGGSGGHGGSSSSSPSHESQGRKLNLFGTPLAQSMTTFDNKEDTLAAFQRAAEEHPEVAEKFLDSLPENHPLHTVV